jgi:hypothetical protein
LLCNGRQFSAVMAIVLEAIVPEAIVIEVEDSSYFFLSDGRRAGEAVCLAEFALEGRDGDLRGLAGLGFDENISVSELMVHSHYYAAIVQTSELDIKESQTIVLFILICEFHMWVHGVEGSSPIFPSP